MDRALVLLFLWILFAWVAFAKCLASIFISPGASLLEAGLSDGERGAGV